MFSGSAGGPGWGHIPSEGVTPASARCSVPGPLESHLPAYCFLNHPKGIVRLQSLTGLGLLESLWIFFPSNPEIRPRHSSFLVTCLGQGKAFLVHTCKEVVALSFLTFAGVLVPVCHFAKPSRRSPLWLQNPQPWGFRCGQQPGQPPLTNQLTTPASSLGFQPLGISCACLQAQHVLNSMCGIFHLAHCIRRSYIEVLDRKSVV